MNLFLALHEEHKQRKGRKMKRIMKFFCAGTVSEEEYEVRQEKDGIIWLDTDENLNQCKQFDIKTGECLNDSTAFGAKRTLKLD